MREILFKAKRIDNSKWVEGLPQKMWGDWHIINSDDENTAYPIDPETLCQYTGLKDKNGKRIWENDIVEFFAYGHPFVGYVKMEGGNTGVRCRSAFPFLDDAIDVHNAVKIGTFFDNPELLKGE